MDVIQGVKRVETGDADRPSMLSIRPLVRWAAQNKAVAAGGGGAVAFLAPANGKLNIDIISRVPQDTQNLGLV